MKMKAKDIAVVKLRLWNIQHQKCKLCGGTVSLNEAVLDHDHHHGHIRGVLHRWCNGVLGKMENWAHRSGKGREFFSEAVARYLKNHATPQYQEIHPTFKTEQEKADAAKARARARRAAKQAG